MNDNCLPTLQIISIKLHFFYNKFTYSLRWYVLCCILMFSFIDCMKCDLALAILRLLLPDSRSGTRINDSFFIATKPRVKFTSQQLNICHKPSSEILSTNSSGSLKSVSSTITPFSYEVSLERSFESLNNFPNSLSPSIVHRNITSVSPLDYLMNLHCQWWANLKSNLRP